MNVAVQPGFQVSALLTKPAVAGAATPLTDSAPTDRHGPNLEYSTHPARSSTFAEIAHRVFQAKPVEAQPTKTNSENARAVNSNTRVSKASRPGSGGNAGGGTDIRNSSSVFGGPTPAQQPPVENTVTLAFPVSDLAVKSYGISVGEPTAPFRDGQSFLEPSGTNSFLAARVTQTWLGPDPAPSLAQKDASLGATATALPAPADPTNGVRATGSVLGTQAGNPGDRAAQIPNHVTTANADATVSIPATSSNRNDPLLVPSSSLNEALQNVSVKEASAGTPLALHPTADLSSSKLPNPDQANPASTGVALLLDGSRNPNSLVVTEVSTLNSNFGIALGAPTETSVQIWKDAAASVASHTGSVSADAGAPGLPAATAGPASLNALAQSPPSQNALTQTQVSAPPTHGAIRLSPTVLAEVAGNGRSKNGVLVNHPLTKEGTANSTSKPDASRFASEPPASPPDSASLAQTLSGPDANTQAKQGSIPSLATTNPVAAAGPRTGNADAAQPISEKRVDTGSTGNRGTATSQGASAPAASGNNEPNLTPAQNPSPTKEPTVVVAVSEPSTSHKGASAPADSLPIRSAQSVLDATPLAPAPGEAAAEALRAAGPGNILASGVGNPGNAELRLHWKTDAFGRIDLHTVVEDNRVGVSLHSERGDLRGVLGSESIRFDTNLQRHDLRLHEFLFTERETAPTMNFSSGQNPANARQASPARQIGARGALSDRTPGSTGVSSEMSGSGGLSLHV